MTREIKFRILKNEDYYKAWENITIDDFIDNELFLSSKVYNKETLSQFTGLKDKNGKDIYEGDIVLIKDYYTDVILDDGSGPSYEENQLLEIVFNNGCFGFNAEHSDLFDKRFYSFEEYKKDISDEDVEVIGNIFENPELINHLLT